MLVYQRVYSSNPRYLHISTCISQSWSTKLKFSSFYLQPWFASNSQHFWGFTSLEGLAEGAKPKCLETTDLRKASREHSGERRCLAHSRWSTSEMSFPESFPVENGWLPTCCNICTGGSKSKCALRNRKIIEIMDDSGWLWMILIPENLWTSMETSTLWTVDDGKMWKPRPSAVAIHCHTVRSCSSRQGVFFTSGDEIWKKNTSAWNFKTLT